MDMTSLDDELGRFREIPVPARPAVQALAERVGRRHRRRLVGLTLLGVAVLGGAVAAATIVTRDDGVVVTTDHPNGPAVSTTIPGTSAGVVPEVVGRTVSAAADELRQAGLRLVVNEGDPAFSRAVVVAIEPPAGTTLAAGAIVGARTALPDPPVSVECPNSRHPRGPASADGLPRADGLARDTAEAEVLSLRQMVPSSSTTEVYLGVWDRWAYTDVGGVVKVSRAKGFQAIVVSHDPSRCGSVPTFRGVPVTYVFGPVDAWAGELVTEQSQPIMGALIDGRPFVLRHDAVHRLCLEIDSVNLGCDDIGPVVPIGADPTTARIAIDPAAPYGMVLAYGYLPPQATSVVADLSDGTRVDGAILGASPRIWALPLPEGIQAPDSVTIVYLLNDGTEAPAPPSR